MDIRLRKSTPDDIPRLNTMIPDSVRKLSAGFYTDQQIEGAISDIFGIDTQLIADQTYYTACANDKPVGCGGWSKRRTLFGADRTKEQEDDLLDPTTESARIRAFFIDPKWARRGIASRIMKLCEEDARQAGFTSMKLVATLPGEQLYAAFGFERVRRYELELTNGAHLPVVDMSKQIAE